MEIRQTRHARRPAKGHSVVAQSATKNKILLRMAAADFALLQPDLESVDLPVRRQLEQRGRRVEHVYFPQSGLSSMVVSTSANHSIEDGIIGCEGMTGLSVLLEGDRPWHETFIQTAGTALRLPAEDLRGAMLKSPTLRALLLRYVYNLVSQMAYTTLANGRYKIEERLARWLLMACDRAESNTIRLTHEFLALMLGARRAGVTAALAEIQKRGIVKMQRGAITVLDRSRLEDTANGSYGVPEIEYKRQFIQGR